MRGKVLVHPGLQCPCGDLVLLTKEKNVRSVNAVFNTLVDAELSLLYLHDMNDHSHTRHCVPVDGVEHCLRDGLKQVLRFLHTSMSRTFTTNFSSLIQALMWRLLLKVAFSCKIQCRHLDSPQLTNQALAVSQLKIKVNLP